MCRTTCRSGRAAGGRGSTPVRPSTGSAATRRRRPPPARRCGARRPRCRRSSRGWSVGRPEKSTPASARAGCQSAGRRPRRVARELHPVLVLKLTFARKGSRIASRSWSRSTSSRMASMVKTCCPGRGHSRSSWVQAAPRGRSSVTAASALGARGSSRGTARTAARPRRPQMRSDSSEVMVRIGLS